ncbi:MAG: HD domain-containing protein [Candidatus Bathyarchaeales archaeon]
MFKLIEDYSKEQMDKLGLYGWTHVQRVLQLCVKLVKLEKCDVDMEVLKAAALLHDVAKHLEKNNPQIDHGIVGAEIAEAFLRKIGFPEPKVLAVCHAIKVHTHSEEPTSTEAMILHDADFLDKLGATGIATIFIKACLTNKTIEEILKNFYKENQEAYAFQHIKWIKIKQPHFYTKTDRTIAKRRNKIVSKFFNQLKREIKLEDLKTSKQ